LLIAFDIFAARRSDLNENQIACATWILVKEPTNTVNPLWQPFRVIKPVYPDHAGPIPSRRKEAFLCVLRVVSIALGLEMIPIDPNRVGLGNGRSAINVDLACFLVNIRAEFLGAVVQEAAQPFLGLKSDQIVLKHRSYQPLMKRQRS